MTTNNILFSKSHEWALIENDTATIGITEYAQEQLGAVAFLDIPENNTEIQQNEAFGVIESFKTLSDLIAPLSGTIIEVNDALRDNLDLFASKPFTEAWIIKIKISNPKEQNNLLSKEQYDEYCQNH